MIIEPSMNNDLVIDARFTVNHRGVMVQINGRQYRLSAGLLASIARRLLPCAR